MAFKISLDPVALTDVPRISKIADDAFALDRHTQMKRLGKKPYDLEASKIESFPGLLASPRCVVIKAVEHSTGQTVGFVVWAFRGFKEEDIPRLADVLVLDEGSQKTQEKQGEQTSTDDEDDIVSQLMAMTRADLQAWSDKLTPEGAKCMVVIGLSVSPEFQRRGVGSALLKWGTDIADRTGVYIWVSSSEPAWPAYSKAGFEVVGTLDVDLDAWAPAPPPKEEGEGAIWGHYVFRYMKRDPR